MTLEEQQREYRDGCAYYHPPIITDVPELFRDCACLENYGRCLILETGECPRSTAPTAEREMQARIAEAARRLYAHKQDMRMLVPLMAEDADHKARKGTTEEDR